MKTINQALGSVVRLEHHGGLATAFFYRNSSDELYLVTNKHVVRAEDSAYSPKILYAHCPLRTSRDKSRYNTKRIRIELYQRKNKGIKWKTPQDPKIDIAALKVEEEKLKGCSITKLVLKRHFITG